MVAPPAAGTTISRPVNWSDADNRDASCVLVIMMARDELNKVRGLPAGASESAVLYFIGKIKGRHPDLSMRTVLEPAYVASLAADLRQAPTECGGELQAVGGELQVAGKILAEEKAK
jgi:hypothetical protein